MPNTITKWIRRAAAALASIFAITALASAQNSYNLGTPAEQKSGLSNMSTYAEDKVETVNLANGNLTIHIPLVTIGGRGTAAYTLALNHNSKLWAGDHQTEDLTPPGGPPNIVNHFAAISDEGLMGRPNLLVIGSGWSICKAPGLRQRVITIDPTHLKPPSNTHTYALTKLWLTLPDGTEVEMRDAQWEGEPLVMPQGIGDGSVDGNRGSVWHSTDGSAITYVSDNANGVVQGLLSGWVYMPDGSRMVFSTPASVGASARCTAIIDPNGNTLNIEYDTPTTGDVTYVDPLGRQVILHPTVDASGNAGATVTIKGYAGVADRVFTVDGGTVGNNLRADVAGITQPIINGANNIDTGGEDWSGPHTSLFPTSDSYNGIINVSLAPVVTALHLLDGRTFRFQYNQYGEVAQITYPGGGVSTIEYTSFGSNVCEAGGFPLNRGVIERRNLPDGVNVDAHWHYNRGGATVGGTLYSTVQMTVTQGESGATLLSELHYFLALDYEYRNCADLGSSNGTGYEHWENAREFRVDRQTSSGTQTEQKTWVQGQQLAWQQDPLIPSLSYVNNTAIPGHGQQQPPSNPQMIQEDTTLESGRLKRVTMRYDQFNNETSIVEYDLGVAGGGNPGPILRQTSRLYAGDTGAPPVNPSPGQYCYTNLNAVDSSCGSGIQTQDRVIHMRRLLLHETIQDGNSNLEGQTDIEYDNYDPSFASHAAVLYNSGMTGYFEHFNHFDARYQPRGNVTKVTHRIDASTNATYVYQFDNAGNLIAQTDPNGHSTTYSYTDNFGDGSFTGGAGGANGPAFAIPTTVTNALGQAVNYQFDYTRTMPTGVKDPNGVITQTSYDAYDRPVTVTAALGRAEQTIAQYTYPTPTSDTSTVSRQLDGSRWLSSQSVYDGFGRTVNTSHNEDGNPASFANFSITTHSIYDGLGRAVKVTNPYRPASSASTDGWTRTAYDLAGRVIEVASFGDGPSTPPPDYPATDGTWTGSVVTTYAGEVTTVHDQANKQRRSTIDGLGRLVQIDEMEEYPSATIYATTTYGYDARGNLKSVTQPGQNPRTFAYDSMSRLTDATNPESNHIHYVYDADSNLTQKTDARGVQVNYAYDAINRVHTRSYANEPAGQNPTPQVTYNYDTATNGVGRLASVQTGTNGSVSTYTYSVYDALGRATSFSQSTGGVTYNMGQTYNLAGLVTDEAYPSSYPANKIHTDYDGAGRVAGVAKSDLSLYYGGAGSGANVIQYTPHGGISVMKLGNNLWEHNSFNSRQQPIQMGLGTSSTDSSVFGLAYTFGVLNGSLDPTKNNGNVQSETITVGGHSIQQSFSYDRVSRLTAVQEALDGNSRWMQSYGYDQVGNRTSLTNLGTDALALPTQSAPAVSSTTNQLIGPAGTYDPAGNLTIDPVVTSNSFQYDGENKQIKATIGGAASIYTYDADGHRVQKLSGGVTTVFVYDVSGELVAEYNNSSQPPLGGGGTSYLTTDHLGSTRVVTSSTQATKSRHDYMPFGEEIGPNVSTRSTIDGKYDFNEGLRQKFTSKERDPESGLDYLEARYYNSGHGRFTSPDEFVGGPEDLFDFAASASDNPTFYADVHNPQSLNKYQYCYSNPLRNVDPSGHDPLAPPQGRSRSGSRGVPGPAPIAPPLPSEVVNDIIDFGNDVAATVKADAQSAWSIFKSGVKALLNSGGKSAAQQDMDDLSGRTVQEQTKKAPPNPHGQQGAPDHQEEVKRQADKAQQEAKPGETVLTGQKIQGVDSTRRPDVQVIGADGKVVKVIEVERRPNSRRNREREAEYDRLGVPHVTVPLPKRQ